MPVPSGLLRGLPRALATLRTEAFVVGSRPVAVHVACLLRAHGGRVNAVQDARAPRSIEDLFVLAASRAISQLTITSGRNVRSEINSLSSEILHPDNDARLVLHDLENQISEFDNLQGTSEDNFSSQSAKLGHENHRGMHEIYGGESWHRENLKQRVWAVLTASGSLPWGESRLMQELVEQQRLGIVACPLLQVDSVERELDEIWGSSSRERACFKVVGLDARDLDLEQAMRTIADAVPRKPPRVIGLEAGPSTAQFFWHEFTKNRLAKEKIEQEAIDEDIHRKKYGKLFMFRRALLATTFQGEVHVKLPRIDPPIDVESISQQWGLEERFSDVWETSDGQWTVSLRVESN